MSKMVTTYGGAELPIEDCIKLTHGRCAGEWCFIHDSRLLDQDCYGIAAYALYDEVCLCSVTQTLHLALDGSYHTVITPSGMDGQWLSANARDNLRYCEDCNELCLDEVLDEDGVCVLCRADDTSTLLEYCDRSANSLKPEDVQGLAEGLLKIGIEVEVEARHSREEALDTLEFFMPRAYFVYKRDGSLSDVLGIEIVTRPDSVRLHKQVWGRVLDGDAGDTLRTAIKGWHGHACGMHVHVSRDSISPETAMRVGLFVNAVPNRKIVNTVAGRESAQWSSFRDKFKEEFKGGSFYGDGRYEAVNFTGKKTIEFRIFRTNLSQHGMLKNIEFVEAVCRYCAMATDDEVEKPDGFVRFLIAHAGDFPALIGFLASRKIVPLPGTFRESGEEIVDYQDDGGHASVWAARCMSTIDDIISESFHWYWNEGNTVKWCIDRATTRSDKYTKKAKAWGIRPRAFSKSAISRRVRDAIRSASMEEHCPQVSDIHSNFRYCLDVQRPENAERYAKNLVRYVNRLREFFPNMGLSYAAFVTSRYTEAKEFLDAQKKKSEVRPKAKRKKVDMLLDAVYRDYWEVADRAYNNLPRAGVVWGVQQQIAPVTNEVEF